MLILFKIVRNQTYLIISAQKIVFLIVNNPIDCLYNAVGAFQISPHFE